MASVLDLADQYESIIADKKTTFDHPGVVKSDTAKALGSKIDSEDTPKSLSEMADEEEYKIKYGATSKAQPIIDPKTAKQIIDKKKKSVLGLADEYQSALKTPGLDSDERSGAHFLDPLWKALDFEENKIVKGISHLMDLKEKPDESDYTYTNLFKDLGLPDNEYTNKLGLAASIFLVPSTYLTFGASDVAKGLKVGEYALNPKGFKYAKEVAQVAAEKSFKELEATGKTLTQEYKNKALQQELQKTVNNMAENLGQYEKYIDKGGVKWAGIRLRDAPAIKQSLDVAEGAAKYLNETRGVKKIKEVASAAATPVIRGLAPVIDATHNTVEGFKKAFIKDYGKDKELLEYVANASKVGRDLELNAASWADNLFKGFDLTPKQWEEVGESAIQADKAFPDKKVYVKSLSGDQKVQNALDRWYSQGAYAGEKSVPEELAKLLPLAEDLKRPNYFPGIINEYINFKFPRNAKEQESLAQKLIQARKGDESENYVRHAVRALATRRAQISYLELHDAAFKNILEKGRQGFGGGRVFKDLKEAEAAGFTELKKPWQMKMAEELEGIKRVEPKSNVYFPKKFVDDYRDVMTEAVPNQNLFTMYTKLFNTNVTVPFFGYHAGNWLSNIVYNSLSIGRHAINPQLQYEAARVLKGKNKLAKITTDLGEVLKDEDILKEAYSHNLFTSKEFIEDVTGTNLSKKAKPFWQKAMSDIGYGIAFQGLSPERGLKMAEAIENQAKLVNYLAWRKKGLSPKLAAMEAKEALIDYSKITDFDKKLRTLYPFYTFSKKNLETFMKYTSYRPGAVAASLDLVRKMGPTDEELQGMTDTEQQKVAIKLGDKLYSSFRLPFEDIFQLMSQPEKEALQRLNPVIKYAVERWATHKDTFTGRDLHEANYANEFRQVYKWANDPNTSPALKASSQKIAELLKLQEKKGRLIMDPDLRHLMTVLPTTRAMSLWAQTTDEEKDTFTKALGVFTGVRPVPLDYSLADSMKKRQQKERWEQAVEKTGIGIIYDLKVPLADKKFRKKMLQKDYDKLEKIKDPVTREDALDQMIQKYQDIQRDETTY